MPSAAGSFLWVCSIESFFCEEAAYVLEPVVVDTPTDVVVVIAVPDEFAATALVLHFNLT